MLYGMIYTYELFFCYNWHELYPSNELLHFSGIYCFLVKYTIQILNEERALTPSPVMRMCGVGSRGQLIWSNAQ